jgi:hypothetical protein
MFVEKRGMDVLTVPGCARIVPLFCLPSTVPVKYTRINSKSPMEWFFMPKRYPETVPKLCPR